MLGLLASMGSGRGDRNQHGTGGADRSDPCASMGSGRGDRNQPCPVFLVPGNHELQWGPVVVTGIRLRPATQ